MMEGLQERPQNVNTCCEGQGTRAFGSLPEYIWSIDSPNNSVYINMFAASTLTYNATVSMGTGGAPAPVSPTPTPPSAGVVAGPAPPLSWSLVAMNGTFPGDKHAANAHVVETLEECQGLCIDSTGADDNQMCMGISFNAPKGPPPLPPPKVCTHNCEMIEVQNGYHTGAYNETQTSNIRNLTACKAACLADDACVELTWVDRQIDPCVLYQTIYADIATGATGWVKCVAGSTDPNKCAAISAGHGSSGSSNCVLYQALDMSHQVMEKGGAAKAPGTNTYMLHGRRVQVQHDYPSADTAAVSAATAPNRSTRPLVTPVQVAIMTRFPYSSDVKISISWAEQSVTAVKATVNLRIPSWLTDPLSTIALSGQSSNFSGTPGSYLKLDRTWKQGDTIAIALPTVYKITKYSGTDQIQDYEGKRFALSVGPIVLACVWRDCTQHNCTTNAPILPVRFPCHRFCSLPFIVWCVLNANLFYVYKSLRQVAPTAAAVGQWLHPVEGEPLHFTVEGVSGLSFMPMWEMEPDDRFTTYPIMTGA